MKEKTLSRILSLILAMMKKLGKQGEIKTLYVLTVTLPDPKSKKAAEKAIITLLKKEKCPYAQHKTRSAKKMREEKNILRFYLAMIDEETASTLAETIGQSFPTTLSREERTLHKGM